MIETTSGLREKGDLDVSRSGFSRIWASLFPSGERKEVKQAANEYQSAKKKCEDFFDHQHGSKWIHRARAIDPAFFSWWNVNVAIKPSSELYNHNLILRICKQLSTWKFCRGFSTHFILILDKCFLDWYLHQGANLIFTEFDVAEVAERISAATDAENIAHVHSVPVQTSGCTQQEWISCFNYTVIINNLMVIIVYSVG